jgi:hypothetical protein
MLMSLLPRIYQSADSREWAEQVAPADLENRAASALRLPTRLMPVRGNWGVWVIGRIGGRAEVTGEYDSGWSQKRAAFWVL